MCGYLQRQLLGYEYLISSRFQSFSTERDGGIWWRFKSSNEFGPITAGHVVLGRLEWVGYDTAVSRYPQVWLRWWMQQRWYSQGIGPYANWYAVFIILPLFSMLILLSLLTTWWSSFQGVLLWSDTLRWVRKEGWNWKVAWGACYCSLCGLIY